MKLHSKISLTGLLLLICGSFSVAFTGYLQAEPSSDPWIPMAKYLGGGTIGILSIMAITRLIQALRNQPLDGQHLTNTLLTVIQKLDTAITIMNTTTRADHDRMLKHDEDFLTRMESLTTIENETLRNQQLIIHNQLSIIKQLDRMEIKH